MRILDRVQPGEQLLCMGCHEPKNRTPLEPGAVALALKRPPSVPQPDVDGTNPFSYPRLVQPVLNKHCVSCHASKADEGVIQLDRDIVPLRHARRTVVFRFYDSLVHDYAFWNYGDLYRTIPGKFGARAFKLYKILKKGHHGVELMPEEMHRITIWLDSVSNFYGVYEKEGGEAQLRGEIALPTLQ